jgi:serine phosphatase RsbU (regulator of sigma subunit)
VSEPLHALETQVAQVVAGDLENEVATAGPSEISSLGSNVEQIRVLVREQTTELTEQRTIAETLQRALLPQTLPTPPGFEITARYLPGVDSAEVGGDWFNVRIAAGGRSFFAIGDVSGRGVPAAALMASMRYGINAYAAENPEPDDVLNRLGRLSHIADHGRFATVLCGLFDLRAGTITLAKAGHLNPLLISNGVARVVELEGGPPIGLGDDGYVANRIPALRGDTLLAYTDGLVERRDEPISAGVERLRGAASVDAPLESLMDRVLATLVPAGTNDDIVILGVRWKSS